MKKVAGQDSEIELNGVKYTGDSNSYSINGLTIEALAETGDSAISIQPAQIHRVYMIR